MTPKTASSRGAYLTIYSLGFFLGMTSKTWWALLNSLITVIVIWIVFAVIRKLMKIYSIGHKEVEKLETKIDKYGWQKQK